MMNCGARGGRKFSPGRVSMEVRGIFCLRLLYNLKTPAQARKQCCGVKKG